MFVGDQPARFFREKAVVLRRHGFEVVEQAEMQMDIVRRIAVFVSHRRTATAAEAARSSIAGSETLRLLTGKLHLFVLKAG